MFAGGTMVTVVVLGPSFLGDTVHNLLSFLLTPFPLMLSEDSCSAYCNKLAINDKIEIIYNFQKRAQHIADA